MVIWAMQANISIFIGSFKRSPKHFIIKNSTTKLLSCEFKSKVGGSIILYWQPQRQDLLSRVTSIAGSRNGGLGATPVERLLR